MLKCKPIEVAYKWFSILYISQGHNYNSSHNNNKNSNKNRSYKQKTLN